MIGCSSSLWLAHAQLNEGIERALAMLPLPEGVTTAVEARFNLFLATVGYIGPRQECWCAALRAAELFRSLGNTPRLVDALIFAALTGARLGETGRVVAALAEAEALIAPDAPARQAAALAVAHAGTFLSVGEHERAIESALRQATLYRTAATKGRQLACSTSAVRVRPRSLRAAIELLGKVIDALRRLNAPHGVGNALQHLAFAHALRGDRDEALASAHAALPHMQRMQDVAPTLLAVALVYARHGEEGRAAGLLGYVDRAFATSGRILYPMMVKIRDEIVLRARTALGAEELDRRMAAGTVLPEEQAVASPRRSQP